MKKAILVANGEFHDEYKYHKGDFIIAVDGGFDYLIERKIVPNYVIGDLDSCIHKVKAKRRIIKLNPMKDDTDALWALKWAIKEGYDTFELYGFLGKSLNHTLGNIQLFLNLKKLGINFKAYLEEDVYEVLHDEMKQFDGEGKFSVLSLSEKSDVTISNALYNTDKLTFTNDFPLGIDNEFIENKKACIEVDTGYILVIYTPRKAIEQEDVENDPDEDLSEELIEQESNEVEENIKEEFEDLKVEFEKGLLKDILSYRM